MTRLTPVRPEVLVDFRRAVLRPELPREASAYPTDHAPGSVHLAAYDGEALVGCASVHQEPLAGHDGPAYRLRGMAVAETHRSQGLGARLLEAVEREAIARGAVWLWCNGRTAAGRFYERAGWRPLGPEFDLGGIPHFVYTKAVGPREEA